jgi:glycosyltransferase involved in cell wall biosynthesis
MTDNYPMQYDEDSMKPISISVLMANYNNARYISEAIESVLKQTSKSWELIICDDSSTDSSIEIITPYRQHAYVRLLQNPRNQGYTRSLMNLIEAATNDIVAILDSDDALALHAIERLIEAYDSHPEAGFVYSKFAYCDKKLRVTKAGYSRAFPPEKTNLHCNRISHIKTFRKSFYEQTQGYDETILYAEDKDLTYKMEEVCPVLFVDDIFYYYRVLAHSQSHGHINSIIGITSHIRAISKAYTRRAKTGFSNLSKSEFLETVRRHREKQEQQQVLALRAQNSPFIFRLVSFLSRHRRVYRFIMNLWSRLVDNDQPPVDPGGFIVCHDKKFMFVAIPRNAVTNLKHIVLQHDYGLDVSSNHEVAHDIIGYCLDGYTRIPMKDAKKTCYRDYLKFAVYRDPVDRFLSLYANRVAKGHSSLERFRRFAEKELRKPSLLQDEDIRPQGLYYQPEDVDCVVALEDLDSFLRSKLNVPAETWLNRSTAMKETPSMRDQELIMRMYKDDYLLRPEPYSLT